MLGCQDFCGYYDWTFHYMRRQFGSQGLGALLANFSEESPNEYREAGARDGLAGLYRCWVATGVQEECDWTFTLDDGRNVLRWDMRQCPSKGLLLDNDLNADEDYCDHCMGWMLPLLSKIGIEVAAHEHNHYGQCWCEMRVKGRDYQPLDLPIDIRKDPRWRQGYLHRWRDNASLPLDGYKAADPCDVLQRWFSHATHFVVVGDVSPAGLLEDQPGACVLATDSAYLSLDRLGMIPSGVLIDQSTTQLSQLADHFLNTEPSRRPLLLHAFLPGAPRLDLVSLRMPRPVPILPQLIREGAYVHDPGRQHPSPTEFLVLLAKSMKKPVQVVKGGIDRLW